MCTYVLQGKQRVEIMDYMMRYFSNYKWSLITLDRRLRHFNIYYADYGVSISKVTAAVENEMNGPGKLLGYRAMQNKMRQKYDIKVPRDRVYDMMYAIHPERLEARQPGFKEDKKIIYKEVASHRNDERNLLGLWKQAKGCTPLENMPLKAQFTLFTRT
ncbi:uncharacterized protein LOC130621627 [Hydractinia symbiolongicarpus]|uniref:uncharacterized protein LOC130621627 n=1 Tax=Hydractinia symbiolongicarpus TaxID=13093 RepID=UPI0025508407|nr:uncharacterized protein LOC130621627 [Hydractinia symbiolongicarpus]